MDETFLPLSRPAIDDHDITEVVKVLKSGWITTGAKSADLEQLVCEMTGAKHAVALCSATAGMHLTLLALGIGPGDEVITPSLTWVSTVNMITLVGATPVFVDVNPNTLMLDVLQVTSLVTEKTKAIIPVHFAGAPADLETIYQLAKQHDIAVIEDSAHAWGTEYKGKPIGSSGTSLFSLHAIKNVTSAEGGIFVTDDAALAEKVRRLKFHGLAVDAFDRQTHGRKPQAEVIEPGFKYNLPDMCAVLALGQLSRIEKINDSRRSLSKHYLNGLKDVPGITPLSEVNYDHRHAWHLMIVKVDAEITHINRDQLIEALKLRNIGAGIHFRPVHQQKYYRENTVSDAELANTERVGSQICSLPLFPDMTFNDIDRVIQTLKQIVSEHEK
ncbi:aminotransferase class I/II-fold pyridoxal phosphate-dependent enzyme [Veronia pacifica]|uniref:UDP-4-amino-4-deoxy-L-arabinose--oxoglutarate aminotransferase n=1 Tax=Veronia pacifica TaxID=1080227 RepID=A0A1C3E977_9GAMM|nr:aminotransferase class I/II-fold pyridoxal phosphate-dependent enzyme [Veronia pacifica]ODA29828.1 UDP-4-amino-4-deoxy-L-arabinose--oxoglutarate aminotransferase [Veronia pacifica]